LSKDQQHILNTLLSGCLKNDRKSQRNLYEHYYGYGLSICLRYSDNRHEAVEILNEAFMKIFTNLKKFDLSRPFKPWLRKILINTCINNFRKKRISFAVDLEEAKNQVTSDEILSGISYNEILDMIRKLSPAYRTVFNLYVIEGYKHEEISEMLDISVGTSKSNLSKAKKNMQLILKDFFKEGYEQAKQG
jgi:RNA polymerase sigma-70 factor (ECF subfamily)